MVCVISGVISGRIEARQAAHTLLGWWRIRRSAGVTIEARQAAHTLLGWWRVLLEASRCSAGVTMYERRESMRVE